MATIVTQNGAVLLKDGRASCTCCDGGEENPFEFDVVVGAIGTCDCDAATFPSAVYCYQDPPEDESGGIDLSRQLSPETLTVNGIVWENQTPNSYRFTLDPIFLQGPTFDELGNITGFQNRVSEPSVINIFGSVGGDVEVSDREPGGGGPDYIPNEGEFECGICDTPRNGPHVININAVMYPNVLFYLVPFTYLRCFPHLRLRVTLVGPYTPP